MASGVFERNQFTGIHLQLFFLKFIIRYSPIALLAWIFGPAKSLILERMRTSGKKKPNGKVNMNSFIP